MLNPNKMSEDTLKFLISSWGAVLATILAAIKVVEFFRERIKVVVKANLIFSAKNETDEFKGTKIEVQGKGFQEILLNVTIINTGRRAVQIVAIGIEEEKGGVFQVIPNELPAVLAPLTSVTATIQKEWIDLVSVKFFGVVDALGNKHPLDKRSLKELINSASKYPSNRKQFKHKETLEIVSAFQVQDKAVIINKSAKDK
jgi:hypothetical protein